MKSMFFGGSLHYFISAPPGFWSDGPMYRGLLFCLILASLTSCASNGPSGMSTNMHAIVASLRKPDATLDTSRMYPGDKDEFQFMTRQSRMEIYKMPNPKGIADALQYTVYYDKSDQQYWVTCYGGVGGISELYGPAKYPPGDTKSDDFLR